ncbi:hypothetical protein F4678DRAFT_439929 [Xylaria arbuscula]|nr:hypothetical protein F4678DRAFT_439929 [Xylaria arbuscula]
MRRGWLRRERYRISALSAPTCLHTVLCLLDLFWRTCSQTIHGSRFDTESWAGRSRHISPTPHVVVSTVLIGQRI